MPDEKEEGRVTAIPSESALEIQLHAESVKALTIPTELVVESDPLPMAKDVVVIASNPQQMQSAQTKLIQHFVEKMSTTEIELIEAKENVANAKKNKWKAGPFVKHVTRLVQKFNFYDKLKCALEQGYVMIPNFDDLDLFAIRTTKKRPKGKSATGGSVSRYEKAWANRPDKQETNSPPGGEGQYVNADTINSSWTREVTMAGEANQSYVKTTTAKAWDLVDFPFHLAKPQILESTAKAMKHLTFDDIGIRPGRHIRRGDPMVVGRVLLGNKQVSFLITWFIDTKDL